MLEEVLNGLKQKMKKTVETLQTEFKKLRTGRASVGLLDGVLVDAYGTKCPLNQVATLSIPESRMILVHPFDPNIIRDIEKSISTSGLGLSPMNDGKLIRIPMPPLTEERRKELVKVVKKIAEESKVTLRNHRREANDQVKDLEKTKKLSEDDSRVNQKKVQDLTDQFIKEIDTVTAAKEKEIMQV